MSKKRKYPSTELSTDQRELVARLVGPLEVRGISRSVFRDVLADADITVPKSSLDRWVRAHAATGRIFTAEKASGATWFKRNILDLTAKSARELIRGRSGKRAQVDYDRLYAYHILRAWMRRGDQKKPANKFQTTRLSGCAAGSEN